MDQQEEKVVDFVEHRKRKRRWKAESPSPVSSTPAIVISSVAFVQQSHTPAPRRSQGHYSRRKRETLRWYGPRIKEYKRLRTRTTASSTDPMEDGREGGLQEPPIRLFQTWRDPKWMRTEISRAPDIVPKNMTIMWDNLIYEVSGNTERLLLYLSGLPYDVIRSWIARGTLSLGLITSICLLWIAYFRLQQNVEALTFGTLSSAMNREVNLGRFKKLTFFGLSFGKTSLAKYTPSPGEELTKPDVSIEAIDVEVVGFFAFLFRDETLKVNLKLHHPQIALRQSLEDENHAWDLGIPLSGADPVQRRERIARYLLNDIVRPGKIYLREATVHLTPSGHTDFGPGRITQTLRGVSGDINFDQMVINAELDGQIATDKGLISASCFCDLDTLIAPGGITVNTNVKGRMLAGDALAAFLNLPFKVPAGICNGGLSVTFGRDLLLPHIDGDIFIEDTTLVFHPDPKTPGLTGLNGRLRFEQHDVFFESPAGVCGTIPVVFDGSLNLLGDYKMTASIRPIDVNALLDTFQLENFFPVEGLMEADLLLSGDLEDPILTGVARSTTEDNLVDKLDIKRAQSEVYWNVNSGRFQFINMFAELTAGGIVTGDGTLSFDMTKLKSEAALRAETPKPTIPPEPEDVFKVDPYALDRVYESMMFYFKGKDISGREVMRKYGGKQGLKALQLFGNLEGEATLGGPVKQAVMEGEFRTSGESPEIFLNAFDDDSKSIEEEGPKKEEDSQKEELEGRPFGPERSTKSQEEEAPPPLEKKAPAPLDEIAPELVLEKKEWRLNGGNHNSVESKLTAADGKNKGNPPETMEDSIAQHLVEDLQEGFQKTQEMLKQKQKERQPVKLRGMPLQQEAKAKLLDSEMSGTVAIRVGDPPEARRMRAQAHIKTIDGRRIQWEDKETRETVLRKVNDARLSGFGKFEGVMKSEPLPPPVGRNGEVRYRQQQLKLISVEGNVETPNLKLNDLLFGRGLNGRFFLNEESMKVELQERSGVGAGGDRLRLNSTTSGQASVSIDWNDTSLKMSASANAQSMFAQAVDFPLHHLLGSQSQIGGILNANVAINLKTRRGNASVSCDQARVGDVYLKRLESNVFWIKNMISLDRCVLQQDSSQYEAIGELDFPNGDFTAMPLWKARVYVPHAEFDELVELLCGKVTHPENLKQTMLEWAVPALGLEERLEWFETFLEAKAVHDSKLQFVGERVDEPEPLPDLRDVCGSFSGFIEAELKDKVSAAAELKGNNWRIGPHLISSLSVKGDLHDDILAVNDLEVTGDNGMRIQAQGQFGSPELSDSVVAQVNAENVPAQAILQHLRHRFSLDANFNVNATLAGSAREPEISCEFLVPEGVVNDKAIWDTKAALSYRDVRAEVRIEGNVIDAEERRRNKSRGRANAGGERLAFTASVPYRMQPIQMPPLPYAAEAIATPKLKQPSPSDVISIDGKIKKHGLLVMNLLAPDLAWVGGQSDLRLKVRGTLENPQIEGYGNVSDGRLWPSFLEDPLRRVRGEVVIDRGQVLSIRGFSGNYNGKPLSINGDLPLLDPEIPVRSPLTVDSRELMLNVQEYFYGKAAGRLSLTGSATVPTVSGSLSLREGVVFVQNFMKDTTGEEEEVNGDSAADPEQKLGLKGLDVRLENDLSVVFPYVMNLGVEGGIKLDGDSTSPRLTGRVDLTDGTINLVTTRLKVKRGSNNYAVFSEDLMPLVEFTLENQGLTMHVRQTRADKWSSALEVMDKSSDNTLDERHWVGVISERLRGMKSRDRLEDAIPDLASKTLIQTYSVTGELGDARWRIYPSLRNVLHPRGALRMEEFGVSADLEQNEAKINFSAALNGFSNGKVSFRPHETFSLNMDVTPEGGSERERMRFRRETDERRIIRCSFSERRQLSHS